MEPEVTLFKAAMLPMKLYIRLLFYAFKHQ
jgi:hypothetical protein